jgi:hypothetical protein
MMKYTWNRNNFGIDYSGGQNGQNYFWIEFIKVG